jgi:RNA polymerase sigma-70 factor (ECF subfamily)
MQSADPVGPQPGSARPAVSEDAGLTERIARKDHSALSQAVAERFPAVFAVARRMVGSDADAEDIAQDVFLRLWRKPPDLSAGKASLATWLYRVTANRSIDWLRRKRPGPLEEADDVPAHEAAPDIAAAGTQVARLVDEALRSLPDRQRLALTLTYYQGLSNIEAAQVMATSVDALESLLSRARRRLRKDLENDWRDLLDAVSEEAG